MEAKADARPCLLALLVLAPLVLLGVHWLPPRKQNNQLHFLECFDFFQAAMPSMQGKP